MEFGDTGIFENLKQKMANPFIFTLFWVFCSWNIKNIFYLLYMPLKIDQRFKNLEGEWWLWTPLLMSMVLVIVLPWINNVIEFTKQKADNVLNSQLNKRKVQEFVPLHVYNAKLESVRALANEANIARSDELRVKDEVKKLSANLAENRKIFKTESQEYNALELKYVELLTWSDTASEFLKSHELGSTQMIAQNLMMEEVEYKKALRDMDSSYSNITKNKHFISPE